MALHIVRLQRGGPWDWSRGLRDQAGFREHASFLDGLVSAGILLLGGPLEGDREVVLVIDAESAAEVRQALSLDPWAKNLMLQVVSVERWTILLDGVGLGKPRS